VVRNCKIALGDSEVLLTTWPQDYNGDRKWKKKRWQSQGSFY